MKYCALALALGLTLFSSPSVAENCKHGSTVTVSFKVDSEPFAIFGEEWAMIVGKASPCEINGLTASGPIPVLCKKADVFGEATGEVKVEGALISLAASSVRCFEDKRR